MKLAVRQQDNAGAIGSALSQTYTGLFIWLFKPRFPLRETIRQFVNSIVHVWGTVVFGGIVQGLFLSWLLGYYGSMWGASMWAGTGSTFLIIRELSVVMTGVLFACKGGTGFTVEIGSMQMSGQINALSLMRIQPAQYLVVPRVISSIFALPVLLGISHGVAILSTMFLLRWFFNVSYTIFLEYAFVFLNGGMILNFHSQVRIHRLFRLGQCGVLRVRSCGRSRRTR